MIIFPFTLQILSIAQVKATNVLFGAFSRLKYAGNSMLKLETFLVRQKRMLVSI
jgi:hypothetical protein